MPPDEKHLPQDVDAEAGVLGSILIADGDPEPLARVAFTLMPEHFYREAYREFYSAALDLYEAGEKVDTITWASELKRRGVIGGENATCSIGDLTECANNVPNHRNIESYAKIVKRVWRLRQRITNAGKIAALNYDPPVKLTEAEIAERSRQLVDDGLEDSEYDDLLPLMTDEEAEALPPARGILGDVLYEDSIAILYGRSGRWKSFIATSWALSIGTGREWLGRPVQEGDVVYVCAEGARGIGKRIKAWKRHHGITDKTRVHLLGVPVQMLKPENVQRLIRTIKAWSLTPVLVVIDTLARSMVGGDENKAQDISAVFDSADVIKRAFGCCVLLVHHPGKDDARGMRGNYALVGNADTIMRVSDNCSAARIEPGEVVTIVSEKPKDSEPFRDIPVTTVIERWATENAEIVSSLVIVQAEIQAQEPATPRLTTKQRDTLEALARADSDGLSARQWEIVASTYGVSHGAFYPAKKWLLDNGYAEETTPDSGLFTVSDPSRKRSTPAGPVQSNLSPIGPRKTSPVQSSVSIDTGLDWTSERAALDLAEGKE